MGNHHAPFVGRPLHAGIGRGIGAIYNSFGIPAVTTAQMEDFAQVMRRLWHGRLIFNHDGPLGKYPILFLDPDFS